MAGRYWESAVTLKARPSSRICCRLSLRQDERRRPLPDETGVSSPRMVHALLSHHSGVHDSPRNQPERDRRIRDPRRFLHDKLLEAESMIALWERSLQAGRAPDAD